MQCKTYECISCNNYHLIKLVKITLLMFTAWCRHKESEIPSRSGTWWITLLLSDSLHDTDSLTATWTTAQLLTRSWWWLNTGSSSCMMTVMSVHSARSWVIVNKSCSNWCHKYLQHFNIIVDFPNDHRFALVWLKSIKLNTVLLY